MTIRPMRTVSPGKLPDSVSSDGILEQQQETHQNRKRMPIYYLYLDQSVAKRAEEMSKEQRTMDNHSEEQSEVPSGSSVAKYAVRLNPKCKAAVCSPSQTEEIT